MITDSRWLTGSAVGGGILWLGCFVQWWQSPPNLSATVALLLLLAILVNTPLALSLVGGRMWESTIYRWALRLQPVAALAVAWALLGNTGWLATLLSLPWLLFAGCLALAALLQLPHSLHMSTPERMQLAALIYFPVGAAWLVAYQLGLQPLGFTGIIVLLTAVHFHYTGFTAILWAGQIGAFAGSPHRIYGPAATGFVAATPLIAAGITLSPLLEIVGVGLLALSLVGLVWVLYRVTLPLVHNWVAKSLLTVAPMALLAAIALAVVYGVGEYLQLPLLTIPQMVQWHGWLNGIGFVFTGLLGWRFAMDGQAEARVQRQPVSLSQT